MSMKLIVTTNKKYVKYLHSFLFLISLCIVIDCGTPDINSNSTVIAPNTTFGNRAVYSCRVGFTLRGDSVRTCQIDGQWSGNAPNCTGQWTIYIYIYIYIYIIFKSNIIFNIQLLIVECLTLLTPLV